LWPERDVCKPKKAAFAAFFVLCRRHNAMMNLRLLLCSLLWSVCVTCHAQAPALATELNEQVVMLRIGSGWSSAELETTIFKPNGDGPFPLVVINHGKAPGNPLFQPRARFLLVATEFVARGYVVALPMRRGFSKSGGAYIQGGCNIRSNGVLQAEDIRDVITALSKRPDIDAQRIVVAGQSHGGLTTMALGTLNVPGVRGLINFAGGFRVDGGSTYCSWEKSLTDAFEAYAAKTALPSLWFYGDNDSYWGADLPKVMHQRYTGAGGKAQLISFGVFEPVDAHGMFGHRAGLNIWVKPVEAFLRSIDMPADVIQRPLKPAPANNAATPG
jgi:dienelactone hydrolase